jgi:hypothetical protein
MNHETTTTSSKNNDKPGVVAPRPETPAPAPRTRTAPAGTASTNAVRRISRILDSLTDAERPRVVGALASLYGSAT